MAEAGISIGFTTYQAGKLFLIGSAPDGRIAAYERTFSRCMEPHVSPDAQTMWSATLYQLWRFENYLSAGETTAEGHDRLYVPTVDTTISGIQNFIGGGTFGPQFAMQAVNLAVAGGIFTGNVFFNENLQRGVEIGGGTFLGRTHTNAARVTIYGSDFELNGEPIDAPLGQAVVVPDRSGLGFSPFPVLVRIPAVLSGTLLDGTPFSFDLGELDGRNALRESFDGTNVVDPQTTLILDLDTELVIVNTDPRNFDPFGFVGFDLTPNGLASAGSNDEPGDEGVTTNDLIFMLNLIDRNAARGDLSGDGELNVFDAIEAIEVFYGER